MPTPIREGGVRRGTRGDAAGIAAIRDDAGDAPLSDPKALSDAAAAALIAADGMLVWEDADGALAGFAAADARDGSIPVLLVARGQDGRGVGRALLAAVCDLLRAAGHAAATIAVYPGSLAEQHYRRAGWAEAGSDTDGRLILRHPL